VFLIHIPQVLGNVKYIIDCWL